MSTYKRLLAFLLATVLLLGLAGISYGQVDDVPVFRIGVIDTEDGPVNTAAQLAVSEINAGGGVVGADGTTFLLQIVSQAPSEDGLLELAVDNLAQANVIAVLGPTTTNLVLDNIDLLQSLDVPIITPALGDTILTSDQFGLLFRSRSAEILLGRALATYIGEVLQLNDVLTIQLDIESTAGLVGFSTVAEDLGIAPSTELLFTEDLQIADLAAGILDANPQVAVVYGDPVEAANLYNLSRALGWIGIYAYNNAELPAFRDAVTPRENLTGIIGAATWSSALRDLESQEFVLNYVQATGEVPSAIEAATYDSVYRIAQALGEPGDLQDNLQDADEFEGVQGVLRPAELGEGELSDNVIVFEMRRLGGAEVVARFEGTARIDLEVESITGTEAPTPTATLDGVFVEIRSTVQNVRTGPGLEYDTLGQLQQGETRRVIGANLDFSWVAIEFRGQNGWLSTAPNLLEVIGNRDSVPVLAAPATPTPVLTATLATTPPPGGFATSVPAGDPNFADIVIVAASPVELPTGASTNVTITMRNVGGQAAGPFAVAASFAPNSYYSAQNFPGLAAGAEQTFLLPVTTAPNTGSFETAIVADLNNQVNEGPAGEANNNTFVYRYRIDRPSVTSSTAIGLGASLDLDGDAINDLSLTPDSLSTAGACNNSSFCIGLLSPALNFNTAHYDAITPAAGISANSIPNTSLSTGSVVGILTSSGRRAVANVTAFVPGSSITITYRTYQ
jgi:branched-chain amino acid transport system substrate-binding protein